MPHSTVDSAAPVSEADIEMPKPTVWPMVLGLSLAFTSAGIALGTIAFTTVGAMLMVISLWKWFGELLPGNGHERVPLATQRPAPVLARSGTVEKLRPGMVGYRSQLPEQVYPISAGLKGGLAGGLVMPIPALTWGILSGHGLWFPVNLLAGIVLPGIQSLSLPELEQFRPILLAIGVVIHLLLSSVIGLVYGVLLPMIPIQSKWQLVFGGILIPMVWTGFSGALMGIANPVLQHYVNWYWFALSQMVFGLAAAFVIIRSEKVDVPPAGTGESAPAQGPQP
jgi:hypothetical protein